MHFCSSQLCLVLSPPVAPDAPARSPRTVGPFLAPLAGFRPLSLAWDTSQYSFRFYTEMNGVSCWTLMYSPYGQGAELLLCPGLLVPGTAVFGLFSPSSALSWLLSAVPLRSHRKPAVPASFFLETSSEKQQQSALV